MARLLRAWLPYEDAGFAIERLQELREPGRWRVDYVAAITLLRAVGHVLFKCDAQIPIIRNNLERVWSEVEKQQDVHRIYSEFIKPERDRVLKTYELGASEPEELDESFFLLCPVDETTGEYYKWGIPIAPEYSRLSSWSGTSDAVTLLSEAHGFWWEILQEVEPLVLLWNKFEPLDESYF